MAPEPDIANPPNEVRERLNRLEAALDESIPAKKLTSILVATHNLRMFGGLTKEWSTPQGAKPKRNLADVAYIAAILGRFDVVAVQEVHGDLRALRYLMKMLGPDWAFMLTDVTSGPPGNDERLAFLFDTRRVKPSGLACELVVWIETTSKSIRPGALARQFARTPYAVSFLASGQTLILVTLHIDYGKQAADRMPELEGIAQWLAQWSEREFGWDHNVVPLGDFNIEGEHEALCRAFVSTGLTPAPNLVGLPRTIFDKPAKRHYYDQIAWFAHGSTGRPALNLSCTAGGNFDFVRVLREDQTLEELSWHISDHYPLWVEFTVPASN